MNFYALHYNEKFYQQFHWVRLNEDILMNLVNHKWLYMDIVYRTICFDYHHVLRNMNDCHRSLLQYSSSSSRIVNCYYQIAFLYFKNQDMRGPENITYSTLLSVVYPNQHENDV
ncbi:hypothetical protein DERP_015367 [Dermatophagoides pteronyssinus]|uniref:Uncharacterized protein n=1 Tax=Dermatophagoides pteronyssinus TaxID=6956 RepID=A0ABQ8JAN6_DERPT|nr:hypothetical protein DERP_015367 [Dermatophagoides pteronyssinus]